MANGDLLYDSKAEKGFRSYRVFNLLDAQAGASAGVWVRSGGAVSGVVTVSGIGTGGITIFSHTRVAKETDPTDADDHETVGSEITANGQTALAQSDIGTDMKCDKTTAGDSTATTVTLTLSFAHN